MDKASELRRLILWLLMLITDEEWVRLRNLIDRIKKEGHP